MLVICSLCYRPFFPPLRHVSSHFSPANGFLLENKFENNLWQRGLSKCYATGTDNSSPCRIVHKPPENKELLWILFILLIEFCRAVALWVNACTEPRKHMPVCTHKHTSANTDYEGSSLISLHLGGMRGIWAVKEWRRMDGKQGGTGKVIKNSSYRCFWSTSKWHACQCQRWAWCIIEMVPTWHLALTSHPWSTWQHASHVVTLGVAPLRINPAPSTMKGIRGSDTHARHQPQRHQTGACAVCILSFMN